jgi:hypothetical protein
MTRGISGQRIDKEVRALDACKSSLNEAFGFVYNSGHERLEKLINEALEEAALLSVLEMDKINERT